MFRGIQLTYATPCALCGRLVLKRFRVSVGCVLLRYPCPAVDNHLQLNVPRHRAGLLRHSATALTVEVIPDLTNPHFLGQERHAEHSLVLIDGRSEEHTSELQSLMRSSYAGSCLKKTN